jgi:hypothetical protein
VKELSARNKALEEQVDRLLIKVEALEISTSTQAKR